VGRPKSIVAISKAFSKDKLVFLAPQIDALIDNPTPKDIFEYGVVAKIKQIIKGSGESLKVSVEALKRAKIEEFKEEKGYFAVRVRECDYIEENDPVKLEAYFRVAKNAFYEYSLADKRVSKEREIIVTRRAEHTFARGPESASIASLT
jgi:ATP-dependent Lon protease